MRRSLFLKISGTCFSVKNDKILGSLSTLRSFPKSKTFFKNISFPCPFAFIILLYSPFYALRSLKIEIQKRGSSFSNADR